MSYDRYSENVYSFHFVSVVFVDSWSLHIDDTLML